MLPTPRARGIRRARCTSLAATHPRRWPPHSQRSAKEQCRWVKARASPALDLGAAGLRSWDPGKGPAPRSHPGTVLPTVVLDLAVAEPRAAARAQAAAER